MSESNSWQNQIKPGFWKRVNRVGFRVAKNITGFFPESSEFPESGQLRSAPNQHRLVLFLSAFHCKSTQQSNHGQNIPKISQNHNLRSKSTWTPAKVSSFDSVNQTQRSIVQIEAKNIYNQSPNITRIKYSQKSSSWVLKIWHKP